MKETLNKIKRNQEIIRTEDGTNVIVKKKKYTRYNINKKTLAQAIIQNNGLISKIAKQVNAPVPTIKNMIKKDKNLQIIQNSTKDIIIDEAESQLFKKIKQGNFQAIKYFLDKQASDRGYNENQNINVNHQGGIVIMPATINNDQWEQSTKSTNQTNQINQTNQEIIDISEVSEVQDIQDVSDNNETSDLVSETNQE